MSNPVKRFYVYTLEAQKVVKKKLGYTRRLH